MRVRHSSSRDSEGSMTAMLDLVRRRGGFRLILFGNMISQLGDWLSYIAISLLTVSSGEGGLALATAYLVHTLPNALLAPIAGRVADRYDRRKVMILSAVAASGFTALMCVSAAYQAIWTLQAFTFARTCVSSFGMTARQAATPSLVKQEELYTANALSSIIWSTLFAAGVAMGGALAATVGPTTAIGIDALTFLLSILVIWKLPPLPPQAQYQDEHWLKPKDQMLMDHDSPSSSSLQMSRSTDLPSRRNMEQDQELSTPNSKKRSSLQGEQMILTPQSGLWACWKYARTDSALASALLAKCPLGVINSAGWMALTLLASLQFNDQSGAILGLFHASRAVGTGVGPLIFKSVWPHSAVKSSLWACAATLGILWSETLWLTLLCLFMFGSLLGYTWVRSSAQIQRFAPSEVLGRLTAFDYSATIACQVTSILLVGALYDYGWGLHTGVYVAIVVTIIMGGSLIRLENKGRAIRSL